MFVVVGQVLDLLMFLCVVECCSVPCARFGGIWRRLLVLTGVFGVFSCSSTSLWLVRGVWSCSLWVVGVSLCRCWFPHLVFVVGVCFPCGRCLFSPCGRCLFSLCGNNLFPPVVVLYLLTPCGSELFVGPCFLRPVVPSVVQELFAGPF